MSYVLIVDDDRTIAESLADMISLFGYQTTIVSGARFAFESIVDNLPSLVLLDLNLPGVDGLEVCRYIKRDPTAGNTPVVFVSVEDDPTIMEEAREAGASGYLVKPVDLSALESLLEAVN